MKHSEFAQLERRKIDEVAREYREKGYDVVVEPSLFPEAFRRLRPDLVALSIDDRVAIEVVSRESVGNRPRLESIAKLVEAMEGWRFELVVTNPRKQVRQDIALKEIDQRLSQARELNKQQVTTAALLLAWSAAEPLLRRLAVREGVRNTKQEPLVLVKSLYSLGMLARSDYEQLLEAAQARNAIAHGVVAPEPVKANEALPKLLDVADRLLSKIEGTEGETGSFTADDLVEWFFENYEDPANGVPYEGGYVYFNGGPYDPWDELSMQFPNADEEVVQKAVDTIEAKGFEWVKRGQY